jgi:hypothetical protein
METCISAEIPGFENVTNLWYKYVFHHNLIIACDGVIYLKLGFVYKETAEVIQSYLWKGVNKFYDFKVIYTGSQFIFVLL